MDKIEYFSKIAEVVSSAGTCARRKVGCVLVNNLGHILATGYNGPPRGFDHCSVIRCPGANFESGTNLDACMAVHAEQNALLQCSNVQDIYAAYVTATPCIHCIKLLLNTSCSILLFKELYPHSQEALRMWMIAGREWSQIK